MASGDVVVGGVKMPAGAAGNVEWAGIDPAEDVAALRAGRVDRAGLLARCLDGTEDEETREDWRDYVAAVVCAAERP